MSAINYADLYRLPFSKNDNFNGWLEVTTHCNIKCPGCYRGLDREGHRGVHKPLEAVKSEVRELMAIRNCSMISISGGEPLMHPEIESIVHFIAECGLKPVILTNGLLLDETRLAALKKAGLVGLMIRVDTLQSEHESEDEISLNAVRERFAALIDPFGIYLTFTMCIDRKNLRSVPDVLGWAEKNAARAGQVLLILKRSMILSESDAKRDDDPVTVEQLVETITGANGDFRFSAYLGSDAEAQKAKWLQAYRYVLKGRSLGYIDRRFIELIQVGYHYATGRYLSLLERRKTRIHLAGVIGASIINRSMRAMALRFLGRIVRDFRLLFARAVHQAVTVVSPPHFVNGRRDLCDGCPDAMLHQGALIPSCGLEEITQYGHPYERR